MKKEDLAKADKHLWNELEQEYILTLRRFPLEPNEFARAKGELSEAHWSTVLKNWRFLTQHFQSAQEIQRKKPVFEDPRTTLQEYCKGNEVAIDPIQCVETISKAGHGRILRSVWRLLLSGKKTKCSVAWMHGIASSGKSQFIRRLRSIFSSDEVDWRGPYLPVRKRNREDIQTQIVTCEEFSFINAFRPDSLHVTKLLFEGEGASVRKGLYQNFTEVYESAIFVVASNALPAGEAKGRDEQFNKDIWQPLCTRVDFTSMNKSHSSDTNFPYTESQLAFALQFLCQHPQLCEKLEIVDTEQVPDFNTESYTTAWYKKQD